MRPSMVGESSVTWDAPSEHQRRPQLTRVVGGEEREPYAHVERRVGAWCDLDFDVASPRFPPLDRVAQHVRERGQRRFVVTFEEVLAHVAPQVRAADTLARPRPEDHQDRLLDRLGGSHRPDPAATVYPKWKRDASAEHAGFAVVVVNVAERTGKATSVAPSARRSSAMPSSKVAVSKSTWWSPAGAYWSDSATSHLQR